MTEEATTQNLETTLPSGGDTPPVIQPVIEGSPGTPEVKNIPESVPYSRFQEVNEAKKSLQETNERLLTILQNQGAPVQAAPVAQEEPKPDLLPMPTREAFTKDVDGYPEFDEGEYLATIGKVAQENAVRTVKHEHKMETVKTETQHRAEQGQTLVNEVIETHPEFRELMTQTQPSPAVGEALFILGTSGDKDDRNGAVEAAFFLAKNPGEMRRLNAMNPQAALVAIGKLSAKLALLRVNSKAVSDAPEPTGPVKVTDSPDTFDPVKSTSKEYARHHPMADKLPWLKT